MHDVQESVRQGRSFSAPLSKAKVFPSMVSQMVAVGEESGTLSEMLASIADFYEDDVETATSQLSATIEPVLIVGLGILIGGMVISLYLPIFTLYGEMSHARIGTAWGRLWGKAEGAAVSGPGDAAAPLLVAWVLDGGMS